MAYFPHSDEDNAAHTKYHKYSTSAIRLRVSGHLKRKLKKKIQFCFLSLKNVKHQNILKQFLDGSVYIISHSSSSAEQKKAEHVREAIDNELGITTPFNCLWNETKVTDETDPEWRRIFLDFQAYFYVEDSTDIVLGYCLAHIVHRVSCFSYISRSLVLFFSRFMYSIWMTRPMLILKLRWIKCSVV